ncbi:MULTISPECIES: hypothetical protein [unclassified Nocardiopsis]|uniref:hypothetical protein n=1 Tax=unclassified Nocardiopsis TaxID=2649073 RepID=UPI00135AC4C1|nr:MULTISPECIES: hypothetical protein [unclassified Nocardiopsis]
MTASATPAPRGRPLPRPPGRGAVQRGAARAAPHLAGGALAFEEGRTGVDQVLAERPARAGGRR